MPHASIEDFALLTLTTPKKHSCFRKVLDNFYRHHKKRFDPPESDIDKQRLRQPDTIFSGNHPLNDLRAKCPRKYYFIDLQEV